MIPVRHGWEAGYRRNGEPGDSCPGEYGDRPYCRLGSALVAAGAPVDLVEEILTDVSRQYDVTVGYSETARPDQAGSGGSPMQARNAFSSASTRSKLPTLPVTNPTEYPPPGQNPP